MSDTDTFSLKATFFYTLWIALLFVILGFWVHLLVHSNDRAAFILGCTWDNTVSRSVCEQQATLKGYK